MQITFKKGKDQFHSLSCRREDGTATWTKLKGDFGPMHDLAHYVVETAFNFEGGFYGLLAKGYDISSFADEEDKSWIGEEGLLVESMVMALQYNMGGVATLDEFEKLVVDSAQNYGITPWVKLDTGRVEVLQERYRELIFSWMQLSPGASLTFSFPDTSRVIL